MGVLSSLGLRLGWGRSTRVHYCQPPRAGCLSRNPRGAVHLISEPGTGAQAISLPLLPISLSLLVALRAGTLASRLRSRHPAIAVPAVLRLGLGFRLRFRCCQCNHPLRTLRRTPGCRRKQQWKHSPVNHCHRQNCQGKHHCRLRRQSRRQPHCQHCLCRPFHPAGLFH